MIQWVSFVVLVGLLGFSIYQNSRVLLVSSNRTDRNRLQAASQWLEANTEKGEVVYNAAWEDFPFLFFHNAHNYYVVGLDAYYLYLHSPKLYFFHHNLADRGKPCPKKGCNLACDMNQDKKLGSVITDKFKSNYILVDENSGGEKRERMRELVRILESSSRFEEKFQDSQYKSVKIFEIFEESS